MSTERIFYAIVAFVALERVFELVIARRNIRRMVARGGIEFDRRGYAVMVALHTAFLAASVVEVRLAGRPWFTGLAVSMMAVMAGAMILRYWVVATLGWRWSTRIVLVPGERLVTRGPYRFLRHPNYLAVVLEFAALPLVHTAWLTAAVFSALNGAVLRRRIREEEAAMRMHSPGRAED